MFVYSSISIILVRRLLRLDGGQLGRMLAMQPMLLVKRFMTVMTTTKGNITADLSRTKDRPFHPWPMLATRS